MMRPMHDGGTLSHRPDPVRRRPALRLGLALTLATVGLPACRGRAGDAPVTDAELSPVEARILATARENQARACPRPVLRGAALPGSAAADLVALAEGWPAAQACYARLKQDRQKLVPLILLENPPPGTPERPWRPARLPTDPSLASRDASALLEACQPVIARVQEAVRHPDACSPYLPGRRAQPQAGAFHAYPVAVVVALQALRHLAAGRARDAAELLLDGLRMSQDLGRGGPSFIGAILASETARVHLAGLERLLASPAPLGAELLDRIEQELGALLASRPHPSAVLLAEVDDALLQQVIPVVKGPGWVPPGGFSDERADPKSAASRSPPDADERESSKLTWLLLEELRQVLPEACPAGATPAACARGLERLPGRLAKRRPGGRVGVLARKLSGWKGGRRAEARDVFLRTLKENASMHPRFVHSLAELDVGLAALRLATRVRRLAEAGACPALAAFDAAPLVGLRAEPFDGQLLRVTAAGPKRFVVRSATRLILGRDADPDLEVPIACP